MRGKLNGIGTQKNKVMRLKLYFGNVINIKIYANTNKPICYRLLITKGDLDCDVLFFRNKLISLSRSKII